MSPNSAFTPSLFSLFPAGNAEGMSKGGQRSRNGDAKKTIKQAEKKAAARQTCLFPNFFR